MYFVIFLSFNVKGSFLIHADLCGVQTLIKVPLPSSITVSIMEHVEHQQKLYLVFGYPFITHSVTPSRSFRW